MRITARLPLRIRLSGSRACNHATRPLSSTMARAANVAPVVGTGPPPEPPLPEQRNVDERIARRKKQSELLQQAREIKSGKDGRSITMRQRFWKNVSVQEKDGQLEVHLDARPLRHPGTREIIRLPRSKSSLAWALALEWDVLTSVKQASKQHLIPLTSLVCRALDIAENDASSNSDATSIRTAIQTTVLRYLDTDSILCWAPPASEHDIKNDAGESLRDVQKKAADEIVSFMTTHVWPGVKIEPVLDGHSIFPQKQDDGVREVVQGWVSGLDAWELAALERAVLAGKSLITASRLVTEWSDGSAGSGHFNLGKRFGVEEATKATNLELDWQLQQWGEVEDTHDVNKEDVRRQFGSVVLLVAGR